MSKLAQRGVPGYSAIVLSENIVLLVDPYGHQTMCVRWGSSVSSSFRVSNGVRQGGILSPYLFNVYVDDLNQTLNRCRTGCLSGNITINHIMYADELVLLSPSATGLRELLCACEEFSILHDVEYNWGAVADGAQWPSGLERWLGPATGRFPGRVRIPLR